MSTAEYRLYLMTAYIRGDHGRGHTIETRETVDSWDNPAWEWCPGRHDQWLQIITAYNDAVAVPADEWRDDPRWIALNERCPFCRAFRPVTLGIPDRVMGGGLVKGATIVRCDNCQTNLWFEPYPLMFAGVEG